MSQRLLLKIVFTEIHYYRIEQGFNVQFACRPGGERLKNKNARVIFEQLGMFKSKMTNIAVGGGVGGRAPSLVILSLTSTFWLEICKRHDIVTLLDTLHHIVTAVLSPANEKENEIKTALMLHVRCK